jgi:hypothetical protein
LSRPQKEAERSATTNANESKAIQKRLVGFSGHNNEVTAKEPIGKNGNNSVIPSNRNFKQNWRFVVLVKTTTVPVNWNTQNQLSVLSMT